MMIRAGKRIPEPVLAGLITFLIFIAVLAVKGIFPFGVQRIDYYDMGQEYAPIYYHIWDFLHGKSSLFYNWYIEEGQNFIMSLSLLSVYNLFFLVIPRHYVLPSLSLFLGMHLFFMTFNMDLFLKRVVPSERLYRCMLSAAYGLCGYTLTHYTVPPFIDAATLAPIYLLTLANLLRSKRCSVIPGRLQMSSIIPFAVITGYMTILNYYLEFMNLIFILLIGGTYVLVLCPKLEKKPVSFRLCTGTLSGVLLSSWILIPTVIELMGTTRIKENTRTGIADSIMMILRAVGADMYYIKWWQLSGSIVAIMAIIIGVVRFRRDSKIAIFILLICFYSCALIPLESINLLFHMGMYFQYPIRCGYWIALILLSAGTYYLSKTFAELSMREDKKNNFIATVLTGVLSVFVCMSIIVYYQKHEIWDIHELFMVWIVFALIIAVLYSIIILIAGNPKYLLFVLGVELVCGAYIGYGQPHFHDAFSSQPEQNGDFIVEAQNLKDDLGIEESRLDRIKNPDTTLNANYGMAIRKATIGGNYEGGVEEQRKRADTLGYSIHFIRILDSGGTIFTDALLHVTQVLTCEPFFCTNEAYHMNKKKNGFGLYDCAYTMPFAIAVSSDIVNDSWPTEVLQIHNMLYKAISGKNGTLMSETREGKIQIDGKKALYICGSSAECITANGVVVPVPTIGEPENTAYPAEFNCNLLFAGIYENETVEIAGMKDPIVYMLDLSAIGDLCNTLENETTSAEAGDNSMRIDIVGSQRKDMVILPLCYNNGFKANVNGENSIVYNIGDMFIGIPIGEGKNHIELRFTPKGAIPGLIITLLAMVLLILFGIKPIEHSKLDNMSYVALSGMWYAALTILYIIPSVAFIIHQIVKRI